MSWFVDPLGKSSEFTRSQCGSSKFAVLVLFCVVIFTLQSLMRISFYLKERVVKICFADNFSMRWSSTLLQCDFRQIGARCNLLKIHVDMLLGDSTFDLRIFALFL